jgi:hypothetical protein
VNKNWKRQKWANYLAKNECCLYTVTYLEKLGLAYLLMKEPLANGFSS